MNVKPLTCKIGNPRPTKKLAPQLVPTAILVAIGLAFCMNNSLTKNQGMEPGPTANMTTKPTTKTMDKYEKKLGSWLPELPMIALWKKEYTYTWVFNLERTEHEAMCTYTDMQRNS